MAAILESIDPIAATEAPPRLSANSDALVSTSVVETPFLTEYLVGDEAVRPEQPALRELLEQLYDSEFDEAVAELVGEAEAHVAGLGLEEDGADSARAERMLRTWIDPLRQQTESMLRGLSEAFEAVDPMAMSESELDEVINRFQPTEGEQGPVFEGFLKSFLKKAGNIAKGAIKAAKAGLSAVAKLVPVGLILRKLAELVRPLLVRVLRFALNKLPVEYRDPARLVARRLLGMDLEAEEQLEDQEDEAPWSGEAIGGADELPATADIRQIQEMLDADAAGLLFAPTEREQDLLLAESAVRADEEGPAQLADLDDARRRFVDGIQRLDEGADPTPLVENFLPAILPVLKIGLKIAGRPRVIRFLAGYLGRLIAPYVGPSVSPGLSRAIVDAGFRAMNLEAEVPGASGDEAGAEGESRQLAAEAFASLVEDTVARVANLSEDELGVDQLLEEAVYSAFQQSAAEAFPAAVLSPESEYLESSRAGGAWVAMPRRGPRRYRKYSRVFDVVIDPVAARHIRTMGGRRLSGFMRDVLGRTGPVRARVHLYQVVPGTTLARIARHERGVAGLGRLAGRTRARLHPLTPFAAAALIGEPGLGREMSEAATDGVGPLSIGQRLYYLEVPGADATPTATGAPSGTPRRSSDASATIDGANGSVVVRIYISEADAQSIATRLRRREPLGAVLASLRRIYGPAIAAALVAQRGGRIRVLSEAQETPDMEDLVLRRGGYASPAMRGFGRGVGWAPFRRGVVGYGRRRPRRFRGRVLGRWLAQAIALELHRNREAFLHAVDAPQDGVTLIVRLHPPALRVLLGPVVPGLPIGGPGPAEIQLRPGHAGA